MKIFITESADEDREIDLGATDSDAVIGLITAVAAAFDGNVQSLAKKGQPNVWEVIDHAGWEVARVQVVD